MILLPPTHTTYGDKLISFNGSPITYDELGRLIEESFYYEVTDEWEEDGEIYYDWYEVIEPIKKYEYTADGKLYRVYDVLNDEYTHYSYDVSGRLEQVIRYKSDMVNDFGTKYF